MRLHSRVPDEPDADLATYARALVALDARRVPFLVGGTYALKHHCGIERDTKDVDLFVMPRDVQRALDTLDAEGFRTELTFPHWLAKAYGGDRFIDLIFSSGNGAAPVDRGWFDHAERGVMLGVPVLICPAEETIWSKAFVMERERYDGADIAHLFLAQRHRLDWARLVERFGDNFRVLLAHLVLFGYVYPREAADVPGWVMRHLVARLEDDVPEAHESQLCRGTLISREQYLVDLERGYRDGRLPPTGSMSEADIERWTEAIWHAH